MINPQEWIIVDKLVVSTVAATDTGVCAAVTGPADRLSFAMIRQSQALQRVDFNPLGNCFSPLLLNNWTKPTHEFSRYNHATYKTFC
jgi:hypothetical protein